MLTVTALYKFISLPDYKDVQPRLKSFCDTHGIKGTLLLALEGINGTICGEDHAITAFLNYLKSDPRFADIDHKESYSEHQPFLRMKVRLKKEIVTLGVPTVDPNRIVGTYVKPEDWNAIISDPDVIVIDTRNDYEVDIGTFKNAQDPRTTSFRQFPDYVAQNCDPKKHKRVAMFCTGGIRCEKASAFMLDQGFEEVYHLKGGILKYLEEVPQEESLWEGECFVFDGRVAVSHGLEAGHYDQCHGCRRPLSDEAKASPLYEEGVCCPACHATSDERKKQRARARQRQMELAEVRGHKHLGEGVQ